MVIRPKKSELCSNTSFIWLTPWVVAAAGACSGEVEDESEFATLKSNCCFLLTSSGYTYLSSIHSKLLCLTASELRAVYTATRVPTNPPWNVVKRVCGEMAPLNDNWIHCGRPWVDVQQVPGSRSMRALRGVDLSSVELTLHGEALISIRPAVCVYRRLLDLD